MKPMRKLLIFTMLAMLALVTLPGYGFQDSLSMDTAVTEVAPAIADPIPVPSFDTPQQVFEFFDALYGAIILIFGFISHMIPFFRRIPQKVYRVFTFALVTGAAAVVFGGANILGLVLTYASTTSVYEVLIKWLQGLFKKKEPA